MNLGPSQAILRTEEDCSSQTRKLRHVIRLRSDPQRAGKLLVAPHDKVTAHTQGFTTPQIKIGHPQLAFFPGPKKISMGQGQFQKPAIVHEAREQHLKRGINATRHGRGGFRLHSFRRPSSISAFPPGLDPECPLKSPRRDRAAASPAPSSRSSPTALAPTLSGCKVPWTWAERMPGRSKSPRVS